MKARCRAKIGSMYEKYAAKGIMYCSDWEFFENFLKDMGLRPEGMTLDRIDGTKGYFKENCRWATPKQQVRNRHSLFVELKGVSRSQADWCELLGISRHTVGIRLARGWSVEDAYLRPIQKKRMVS